MALSPRVYLPVRRSAGAVQPDDVLGPDGDALQLAPGGRAQGGGHRGRGRDVGGLAHALEAVRRLGIGVLQDLHPHGRHVEHGGQEVVGERRVEDLPVADLDLLEQREAEALRRPALDLALERLRVHRAADLLRRRELDDAHESELAVDVDDRAVRGERELQVRVALAVRVERVRLAVVPLDRLLDRVGAEDLGQAGHDVGDRVRLDARALGREREQPLADRLARGLHRAAADVGLARGGARTGRGYARIRLQHRDALDAELGARDLRLYGDDALADLGRGGVDLDERALGVNRQADAGGRVVVEALGEADVLEADGDPHAAPDALA